MFKGGRFAGEQGSIRSVFLAVFQVLFASQNVFCVLPSVMFFWRTTWGTILQVPESQTTRRQTAGVVILAQLVLHLRDKTGISLKQSRVVKRQQQKEEDI